MSLWNRIKQEPTIVVQTVQALLAFLVGFEVFSLTDTQTGVLLTLTSAVTGFVLALSVRPFQWPVVTGLVQAGIAALAAFGAELDPSQVAAIYGLTAVLGAWIVRQKVTPETKLPPVALAA